MSWTQIKHKNMRWSAALSLAVEAMETPEPYTVVFKVKKPNSRFHALFTVRWGAVWIMPKHVFEKVEDPLKFDFNKPVSLGAYVLHNYDPDGRWYIWRLRDDWQRTTLARYGKPGPKYLAYVDPGPPDKRVIAQMNHQLDVIHDVAPEGMFTLAKQSKSSVAWFKGFPYAHPDPTLPALLFNAQNALFKGSGPGAAPSLLRPACGRLPRSRGGWCRRGPSTALCRRSARLARQTTYRSLSSRSRCAAHRWPAAADGATGSAAQRVRI
jgi:peptide/nickel transport system substrate-binding protein